MRLPIWGGKRQLLQFRLILSCRVVPGLDERLRIAKIHQTLLVQLDPYLDVCQRDIPHFVLQHRDVHCLPHDAREGVEGTGNYSRHPQGYTNNNVHAHLFRDIRWEVVDETAVSKNPVVPLDGRENTGDRHGCPEGFDEMAVAQYILLTCHEVYRDATEGDRQLV